jgi:tetratricopeptide (TPR) repeat protein
VTRVADPPLPDASLAPDWREHLQHGRLSEALSAHLASPQPAAEVSELLDALGELRGYLRAKRWDRAARVTEALASYKDLPALLPELNAEVARLGASGRALERAQVDEALALLGGVQLPLLLGEAATQRGTAQIFLGDPDAAERTFQEALRYDPKHYRALTNLGNVALEQGRTDDAIGHYEAALKLNEGFANAHHNLGVAYRRKGQVNRSVASIRRAQRVSRQLERDEARSAVRSLGGGASGKLVRWALYALLALGLFVFLRSQGVI